jgi:hypothetical protein
MWILPKQLRTSLYAADTEALTSDSVAASQACAQSLIVRSKPQRASYFLRAWKAGNLTRLRSGLISSPFLGGLFEAKWTSSLEVIPANHSQQPVDASGQTIQDTSGRALQPELPFCAPESASLKTSKDILASDLERSLRTWNALVTTRRGEYLARLNAARHTSENECSSWPSPVASEVRQGFQDRSRGKKGSQESLTTVVIKYGQPTPANRNTRGSRQGSLNPRWVETLMGLPVGWTMPSCSHPVTTVQTNSGSSATE